MNQYRAMTERQQKAYNEFSDRYMFYAFSDQQFAEGLAGLQERLNRSIDRSELRRVVGGAFILKEHVQALRTLADTFQAEQQAAIEADTDGTGFLLDMFKYEMFNHEYGYTGDPEDTLDACGVTWEQIEGNEKYKRAWVMAADYVRTHTNE